MLQRKNDCSLLVTMIAANSAKKAHRFPRGRFLGGIIGPLLLLVYWLDGCSYHVSTKFEDYEIEGIDRRSGKWYWHQESKSDSFFVRNCSLDSSWLYGYLSKEPQLNIDKASLSDWTPGQIEVGHFQSPEKAAHFFQGLIESDPEIDCVIRISEKIYLIDDESDLLPIIEFFEEFVTQGLEPSMYEKYEQIDPIWNNRFGF
jgi:hypothetical protein